MIATVLRIPRSSFERAKLGSNLSVGVFLLGECPALGDGGKPGDMRLMLHGKFHAGA